jgi:hypothetical protein
MDKIEIIIQAALERYRPIAAQKVEEELCALCRDRRCEKGAYCNAYHLLLDAKAWEMVSAENN